MVEGKGTANDDVRSDADRHEEYLKLCALSTSGSLSDEEQQKLREHLAVCATCREAMKQFETVVDHGIPALARDLGDPSPREDSSFSVDRAEKSFFKRLSEEEKKLHSRFADGEPWLSPLVIRQSRNFRRNYERYYFWLPTAAVLLLCASLGIVAYRTGMYRGVEVGRREQQNPVVPRGLEPALATASHERDAANAQLAERGKAIATLQRELAQRKDKNAKLRESQSEEQATLHTQDEQHTQLTQEKDRLAKQTAEDGAELEAKLNRLEAQRSEDAIWAASLEAKVAELSRSLQEEERSKAEENDLLEKNRDIRELMGARDLYVAEVHDVARTGETEKAFGRVFYTEGKSLIFYVYDLNEQPGIKEASTFQAWGRRGPDWTQAYKLGMFYEDNAAKKRWVMTTTRKGSTRLTRSL
jgi:Putative zinc-finger